MSQLNGVFEKDVGPFWRLRAEWTATQNHSANTSSVTVRLYWMADRSGVGAVFASQQDTASITINGSTGTTTASPYLNAGQKKLIHTRTVTVPHNSDGTKTLAMSAFFDIKATLSGTYYNRESISTSVVLRPIPRESTLSGNANWTAGQDVTTSITRSSTSFSHEVKYYVKNTGGSWILIRQVDYSTAQVTRSSSFTFANNELIYSTLAGRTSADSRIVIDTFSGSTFIGGNSYDGTVTALQASFTETAANFDIGSTFNIDIKRYSPEFNHTVRLKNGGTTLKTYSSQSGSTAFDTASIATTLYNLTPNSNSLPLTIEVQTFWGSASVRTVRTEAITARVTNSNPTLTTAPTYADVNSTTTAITGNNQFIISEKSSVTATLTAANRALARNGATMVNYVVTLGGKTSTQPWSASVNRTFAFGTITATSNQTLVIRAVDSRGNSTTMTRVVTMIPYSNPAVSVSANRVNGFERDTILTLAGTVSRLVVSGADKNAVLTSQYRFKDSTGSSWGAWVAFPVTGFPSFSATDAVLDLPRLNSFDIEVQVTDKLGTTTVTRTVGTGKPIMFIDELNGSVGFGDFPDEPNQMLITNQVKFAEGRFGTGGGYSIDFQKGNTFGHNAMFFNDETTGSEGINFPKQGVPDNSRVFSDYHNLRVYRNMLRLDGETVGLSGNRVLWSGTAYPSTGENNAITPSRSIHDCPSGWVLVWSEYVIGGSATNAGYHFTHIPKEFVSSVSGSGVRLAVNTVNYTTAWKYLYINANGSITAHSVSSTGENRLVVLRHVLAY